MEKDYDLMMKCRAIFVRSFAILIDGNYCYDNKFEILLKYFFDSFVYTYPEVFEIIYDVRTKEDGEKYIYEDKEMHKLFIKYLKQANSNYELARMCDEVGQNNVEFMSRLAEILYEYVMNVAEINNEKIRILH